MGNAVFFGLGSLALMIVPTVFFASMRWKWLLILFLVLLLGVGIAGFAFGRSSSSRPTTIGSTSTNKDDEAPPVDVVLKSAIKNWASGGKVNDKKSVSFGPTESQPFRTADTPRTISAQEQHTADKNKTPREAWV